MSLDILYFTDLDERQWNNTHPVALAPMAGVADSVFRRLCRLYGASPVYTELVSADGLVRSSEKTIRYLRFVPEERPIGIQLFGSEPAIMAEAAVRAALFQPDLIDINFGCPVRKVVRRGAGAALMRDLDRMTRIAEAIVRAVSIPVTAKIRSGWSHSEIVAVEAARRLESVGIRGIALHARTQTMGYSGCADWSLIRDVKEAVSIPIMGNGDVVEPEDARRMLDETGCDGVMIGRGAMGRPWIFQRIHAYLQTGLDGGEPDPRERIEVCIQHLQRMVEMFGPRWGLKEMRKHIGWYLKGLRGCHVVRQEIFSMHEAVEIVDRLKRYADELPEFF